MTGINLVSGVVKILEAPRQTLVNKTVSITEFRVQLPQFKNTQIIDVVFWDNLGKDVMGYYKLNDYVIVEGYLSTQNNDSSDLGTWKSKRIQITALKVYPVLLSSSNLINKG